MQSNSVIHPGLTRKPFYGLGLFRIVSARRLRISLVALTAGLVLSAGRVFSQTSPSWPDQDQASQPEAYPQNDPQDQSYPQAGGQSLRQPMNAVQLEQLVAPIALYPDALVAQVLAASTYPAQLEEAYRWRQGQRYSTPEQLAYGADAQPWDPSVKALTAFPSVLEQMDRNLQWTTDLGNAYYNQPQDVLEAVQVMRRRAQAAGNLRSTPQEVVRYDEGNIALAPANPQVVYVPAYNPWGVYGEPVAPYPGFSLLGAIGDFLGGDPVRYGLGIALSAFTHTPWGWLAWGLNWLTQAVLFHSSDYYSHSASVADWGFSRHEHHAYWDHGGFGRGREFGRMRDEGWRHGGSGWHDFGRGMDWRGAEGRGFDRRASNWGGGSARGFESFRGERGSMAGHGSRVPEGRGEYGYALNRGGAFERGGRESYRAPARSFPRGEFGGGSSGSFTSSYGKSHSGGSHLFGGGHSPKGFGGGGSGFHGGGHSGGGHAPKFHGGGFGGGHSHGGGRSSGHGGGKHHR